LCKNRGNDKESDTAAAAGSSGPAEASASINGVVKMDENEDENGSFSAELRGSASSVAVKEVTYDPEIHTAMWQNDLPFVLQPRDGRIKTCRGCRKEFAGSREFTKFVIRHEERRDFWDSHGKKTTMQNAFYHCKVACIQLRHPYFKFHEVTLSSSVAGKLTEEDAQLLSRFGINLSFYGM